MNVSYIDVTREILIRNLGSACLLDNVGLLSNYL